MRKTKEDALTTKERILSAAFKCFLNNGFKTTSLEMIAAEAELTRGAIYWHYKDKKELYREVVNRTLSEYGVVKFAYSLSGELSYEERLYELFWFAQSENSHVDLIYKALNIVSYEPDLKDLQDAIQMEKIKLFRYFAEETRIHIRESNIDALDPEIYAANLFFLFEGMFLTKHLSIGIASDKDNITKYIRLIIKDLI